MDLKAAELLVFDLDGTLIDSGGDIAWAANRTLADLGHERQSTESVRDKIGSGVVVLLERLMPEENSERIAEAKDIFLRHYGGHLVVDTYLYPGVMDTLTHFKETGRSMAIVTNKPKGLAEGILAALAIDPFFPVVVGGDTFANRKPHPEPLEEVMRISGVEPARSVFIGDSLIDAETGRRAGVFTVGVSYGFGRAEVRETDFNILIRAFGELKGLIC